MCRASKRTLTLTTTYNFLSIVYLRDRLVTLRSRVLFLRTCGATNARPRNTVRLTQDSRTSVGCCVIRRSKRSKNRVRLFFSTYQRKSLRSKRNHLRCSRLLKRKKITNRLAAIVSTTYTLSSVSISMPVNSLLFPTIAIKPKVPLH